MQSPNNRKPHPRTIIPIDPTMDPLGLLLIDPTLREGHSRHDNAPIVPAGEIPEPSSSKAATDFDCVFDAPRVRWTGFVGAVIEKGDVDVDCVPEVT